MELKKFKASIAQLAEEKGISEEKVIEIIETAMAAAYKRDYGKKNQKVEARLDEKTGELEFWQLKQVVDESMILSEEELEKMREEQERERPEIKKKDSEEKQKVRFNPERHILLKEAKKLEPSIELEGELRIPLKEHQEFGRIAAQTAKQVILQKLKEAEREIILQEYKEKEGEIISGTVQRSGVREVFFDIGKILGLLPKEEQIPGEFYKIGQRFKLFVLRVESSPKGPLVFLSRAFPKFVSKLFELEVPEISAGQVEIKSIAREPGSRSKVAVISNSDEIDPIGSAIGQRGTRVLAVISELGGEKIDIVEYSENPEEYIANALAPAKVLEVKIMPKNKAVCLVPGDQLSLAIGKEGQNVRLAAKLTGWKIDVDSIKDSETKKREKQDQEQEEGLKEEDGKEKKDKKRSDKKAKKPEKAKKSTPKKKEEEKEKKSKPSSQKDGAKKNEGKS